MKYFCELCNYDARTKFCLEQHQVTKKHRNKVKEMAKQSQRCRNECMNNSSDNENKCCYCQNKYTSSANLTIHKKACGEKIELINSYENQINELHKQYKLEIKELKNEIEHIIQLCDKDKIIYENSEKYHQKIEDIQKEQIDNLKDIISNNTSVVKTSVSALAYVAQNYVEALRLLKLADYGITTYNRSKAIDHKQDAEDSEDELSDVSIEYTEEREDKEEKTNIIL